MEQTPELKKALEELKRVTGIPWNLESMSEEEMAHAVTQIRQLSTAYKEKYNKNHFLQHVLLGSILPGDIHESAKKLHIEFECPRTLFLVETDDLLDDSVLEILKNLFPAQSKCYVVTMGKCQAAVLRQMKSAESDGYGEQIAHMIVDTLNAEAMARVRVSYSRKLDALSDTAGAYKETSLAIQVGKLFYSDQTILPYNQLGVGRLVYQLPLSLCEDFLTEIFGEEPPQELDEETASTVNKFFQNNLNIAETSRQLHVHRNTLIYRLEQIQKRTGLDIRTFEDALTFKIAIMVMNYTHSERKH